MGSYRVYPLMRRRLRISTVGEVGSRIRVEPEQAHHLVRVLRMGQGDRLYVWDKAGQGFEAEIVSVDPCEITLGPTYEGSEADPGLEVEVLIPILKAGRTDALVRQLTEVGATRVIPMVWERGQVRPDSGREAKMAARWQRISEESTRQCGRSKPLDISVCGRLIPEGPGLFFHTQKGQSLSDALQALGDGPCRIAIGPEGGFSEAEVASFVSQGWQPVHLGPRVLRAETAVIAAAVLLVYGVCD